MDRKISFSVDEYYHLYNRGVNKMKTYMEPHDYWRFLFLMYLCNTEEPVRIDNLLRGKQGVLLPKIQEIVFAYERPDFLVDIGAFCLMPNHYHLLVRERIEGGISKFMLKLGTAYSSYVNRRHSRTGALFGSRFHATHVDTDEYLKYLYAYIHLNPVKLLDPLWKENGISNRIQAEEFLAVYPYSSYRDYALGDTVLQKILSKNAFPEYFLERSNFADYINDFLNYKEIEP